MPPTPDSEPHSLQRMDNQNDDDDTGDATPPVKRMRLEASNMASCEICKSRKVRCDRARPACGWCARNGQVCEYKEKRKPGLRTGYGKELESRLDQLEARLEVQQSVLDHLSTPAPDGTVDRTRRDPLPNRMPSIDSGEGGRSDNRAPGEDPSSRGVRDNQELPVLSIAQSSNGHSLTTAPSPSLLEHPGHAPFNQGRTVTVADPDMPPHDLLYDLVNLYFEHINPWCPILHRQATFNLLFGGAQLSQDDRILLHALVAASLRFSQDDRLQGEAYHHYYNHSKQIVLLHGMELSSVKSLQALTILAFDTVGSSNGPPSLNLLALIARNVAQLGLAVESAPVSSEPLYPSISTLAAAVLANADSFIEEESRRRLFWGIYVLDRFTTVATALNFTLDEQEIRRRLPCREDAFSAGHSVSMPWILENSISNHQLETMGPFSFYVKVVMVLSKIHAFLRQPFNILDATEVSQWQRQYRELDTSLRALYTRLPITYEDQIIRQSTPAKSGRVNTMWFVLYATYYMTTIRLHSSAAFPTHQSQLFAPSSSANRRCLDAVDKICIISRSASHSGLLHKLGPHFAFCVWVAARLLLVQGSTIDHHVSPAIQGLVDALDIMGQSWKVAGRYHDLLKRVLAEYEESRETGTPATDISYAPHSVRVLADMRRCAYDLDLLISSQPRLQSNPSQRRPSAANETIDNSLGLLDVFEFFNMPRLHNSINAQPEVESTGLHHDPATFPLLSSNDLSGIGAFDNAAFDWLGDYDNFG